MSVTCLVPNPGLSIKPLANGAAILAILEFIRPPKLIPIGSSSSINITSSSSVSGIVCFGIIASSPVFPAMSDLGAIFIAI